MQIMFKASMILIFAGLFSGAHALDARLSAEIRCLIVGLS
jgi:hypothetical protein